MGSTESEPKGPDLTQGVPVSEIREGVPFAGHVEGEAVVLVRTGDDVVAIGATCTHYGGPLAEGLVVDGEIRCPWHHACFSLRTGDAIKPPALNPLPRWRVEQQGDVLFVREKLEDRDALARRGTPRSNVRAAVIIGGGAAGNSAAESLRAEGYEGSVTIIDPDIDAPYDRPNLSKDFLAGAAPDEWLPLRPPGFHEQHGIRRIRDVATAIDTVQKQVTLGSGESVAFDALVLALGAVPIRPPIPGLELPHVHVLRTVDHCKALMNDVAAGTKVVIAGASFIGMEAAAALRHREAQVTVVGPETIPFEKVLGATIGTSLKQLHEKHGVSFRLGRKLEAIREGSVSLDDGTTLDADVVLLGVGVKPNPEIAKAAGIETDNGVLVNEFLETNIAGIYAAGDIAQYPDPISGKRVRIEHWVVAQRQGQVVARNILGEREKFSSVPFFWTVHYDTTISYVGHAEDYTDIRTDGSPETGDFAASFMRGDKMLAFVSIGRDEDSLKAERKLEIELHERQG